MFQALDNKDCKGSPYLNNIYLEDLNFSSLEHVVLYILRFCEYVARAVVQAPSGNAMCASGSGEWFAVPAVFYIQCVAFY